MISLHLPPELDAQAKWQTRHTRRDGKAANSTHLNQAHGTLALEHARRQSLDLCSQIRHLHLGAGVPCNPSSSSSSRRRRDKVDGENTSWAHSASSPRSQSVSAGPLCPFSHFLKTSSTDSFTHTVGRLVHAQRAVGSRYILRPLSTCSGGWQGQTLQGQLGD